MHREGDLFFFDAADQRDYPALSDQPFVPVEAIHGVFQGILDTQQANMAEIQRLNSGINDRSYAEYLADVQPLHVESIRLQRVADRLFELAGVELIDEMLPSTM